MSKFYEEYHECFDSDSNYEIESKISNLIQRLESHFNIKFNFDNNYLYYPHFKSSGKYENLLF